MYIFLAFLDEEAVELGRRAVLGLVLALGHRAHQFHQLGFLLITEQVRHLIRIQQIIHVLHKALIFYLAIREQKDSRLILAPRLPQNLLQILLPLNFAVGFGNFNLENGILADFGGEASETLPA